MQPINLTEEEREALKQNLMRRYAAADTIEPQANTRKNINDWGEVLTEFASAGSRGNLGQKFDSSWFDKQRAAADQDILLARQDRSQSIADAKNLLGLGYGEEEMQQKRKEWQRMPDQWERQDKVSDYALKKLGDEETVRRDSMDPNSPSSYVKQELARRRSANQFMDSNGKARYPEIDFKGVSGAEIGSVDDMLRGGGGNGNGFDQQLKLMQFDLAKQGRDIQQAAFQAQRAQEQYHMRKDTQDRDDRIRKETDEKVANYQKSTEPLKSQLDDIAKVERELSFPLEKYDSKTGTVDGKKIDLPGVSIPPFGRVTAYDTRAQDLQIAMDLIINKDIKDNAGSAVSSGEMERIKRRWAMGAFNTEEQMIGALRDYKAATQRELQRVEAVYKPEIRDQYRKNLEQTPGPVKPGTVGSGGVIIHERSKKLP
jgi:hypothetical protein